MLSETFKSKEIVYLENPQDVLTEVQNITLLMFRQFDFNTVKNIFDDILKLFGGNYPGYRKCNTMYHDLHHTTNCMLVMARLIHGASLNGIAFTKRDVALGLISALMHDTGYIQSVEDDTGTGAQYTLTHILRSIYFMERYFLDHGYPREDFLACRNFLRCTGFEVKIDEIRFHSWEHEILGKILGTADLLAQMGANNYLVKLPFLYYEFKEGAVPGYADEFDLLKKTPNFWGLVKERFATELGQVDRYMRDHFRVRWGINQDLHRLAIERNLGCLELVLENFAASYPEYVRRENIMEISGGIGRVNRNQRTYELPVLKSSSSESG